MGPSRRIHLLALAALFGSLLAIAPSVGQEAADTVFIAKDGETPTNTEISIRLSQATPMDQVGRIVLARDDEFADALASGVMQTDAPLMLVSPAGVQQEVLDHMGTLGTDQVVLLGGEAALPSAIESQLVGLGYQVERRQGPTRIETAVDIATRDAADATDAILVRAFAAPGASDPTQAFADSLAAGGFSARTGAPILLTQSDVLTGSTRDHLANSSVQRVFVVGGTAAVSESVVGELQSMGMTVERISGASRAGTAVEVAKVTGAETAEDVARVTLVQGQTADAWAGGFAAAAHSAMFDAPIVLGSQSLPPETETFLAAGQGTFAGVPTDPQGIRITCVVDADLCRVAREALDLPPIPPSMPDGPLVETSCPISAIGLDDDASVLAFVTGSQCEDLGLPEGGFGVVDVATGDLRVVPQPGLFQVSVDDDGDTIVVSAFEEAYVYDLGQDPPALIRTVVGQAQWAPALSGDGTTMGVDAGRTQLEGDFYDIASGTASGPNVCMALIGEGFSCSSERTISGDGAHVYSPGFPPAGGDPLAFTRWNEAGQVQSVDVDVAGVSQCTQVWPVGPSGDLMVVGCGNDLVVVDFPGGTVERLPLPEANANRQVTGAAADGTLVSVLPATLINPTTGATSELPDTFIAAVSEDGQWVASWGFEGIVLQPSAELRP